MARVVRRPLATRPSEDGQQSPAVQADLLASLLPLVRGRPCPLADSLAQTNMPSDRPALVAAGRQTLPRPRRRRRRPRPVRPLLAPPKAQNGRLLGSAQEEESVPVPVARRIDGKIKTACPRRPSLILARPRLLVARHLYSCVLPTQR